MPAGEFVRRFDVTGDLRGDAKADLAPAHFGKTYRPAAAVGSVDEVFFAFADFLNGPPQVAVPFEGVHREIEMRVEDQHSVGA